MYVMVASVNMNAFTDTASVNSESLQKRIEAVLNKAGISFGGVFRSEHFQSAISGNAINPSGRTIEYNEYSSVDFDIQARPNAAVSGRLVFRMHHNWQNFWSDPGNPIFSRWISIDGSIAGKVPFHVGDFKVRYTPLTLYAPEVGPLYEPEIFEMRRQNAMDEEFLGGNERPLQGATVGLSGALDPLIDQFHFNALGTRLRNVETNRAAGYVVTPFEAAPDFSKLLLGSDMETRWLHCLTLGGAYLLIADNTASSRVPDSVADTSAQRTSIGAVRADCDVARWLNLPDAVVRPYGEAAFSFDDTAWYNNGNKRDLRHSKITGNAAYGGVRIQMPLYCAMRIGLDIRYIRNDVNFRNELAQSPTFIGKRIMNIESDSLSGKTVTPNHYSTFDALYNHVFKFCPSDETNLWQKAPFAKDAYTDVVYTRDELKKMAAENLDPSLQLVMPYGPATPNRQGIVADFSAGATDSAMQARALFSALSERKPDMDYASGTTCAFLQAGMGLKADVSAWWKRLSYPLRISGSFVRSSARNSQSGFAITSNFTNAGIYWKFYKQTALLGGMQFIHNTFTIDEARLFQKQIHWSTGIVWSVTQGADIVAGIGRIAVSGSNNLSATSGPQQFSGGDFSQMLSDISLKVVF